MGWGIDLTGSLCALGLLVAAFLGWQRYKKSPEPALFYSDISLLKEAPPASKTFWHRLPKIFYWIAFALLLTALVDPVFKSKAPPSQVPEFLRAPVEKPLPEEGIAIYLVLDHSGSMGEEVLTREPGSRRYMTSKLKLLKSITEKFIAGDAANDLEGRPNDMIGVVTFARSAQVVSPLTLEHDELLRRLRELDLVKDDDQQGTSIGYAIYKTANLITATRHFAEELISEGKPSYTINSAVILLVTDGMQELNPLDKGKKWRLMPVEEAAQFAAQNDIRLYIINVDPKFNSSEYAAARREMERYATKTGGKFFLADDNHGLADIYQQINQLEKSSLPSPEGIASMAEGKPMQRFEVSHFTGWLLGLGALFLLLGLMLETLWLKRIP